MIDVHSISTHCTRSEFVGTAVLDTIGLVMADTAMKSAPLSIAKYMTPDKGTSHSNEVILSVSGDASAAKTAVLNARQTGLELLIGMGSYPEIPGIPYL